MYLKSMPTNFLTPKAIEERAVIVKQLEQMGIPVLEMLLGSDGKFCQRIRQADKLEYCATVSRYIDMPLSDTEVNLQTFPQIATTLRSVHKGLASIGEVQTIRQLDVVKVLDHSFGQGIDGDD